MTPLFSKISNIWHVMRSRYSIYLVLIVMFFMCVFLNENFLSSRNLANISAQVSVTTILAFGETLLIIGGMLDLSCGSVLAFAGLNGDYAIPIAYFIIVSCEKSARFNSPAIRPLAIT